MTAKQPDFSELNQLAIEACDMWQEHLSTLATNPDARVELTKFLEPQRRIFADWAGMMQGSGGGTHDSRTQKQSTNTATNDTAKSAPAPETTPPQTAPAQESRGAAYGDDSLRVAQLALRVAELEKRLARLESKPSQARKPQRTAS